jgi:C-terminal processing protease CtpA/Prc
MISVLGKNLSGLVYSVLFFCAQVAAQEDTTSTLHPDEADYYLVQAFQAARAEDRIALNHIGIETSKVDGGYLVTAALEGYPAHQAGIERGDKIVSVDDRAFHPVNSFNDTFVATGIFSPETDSYRLEYERAGAKVSIEITPVFENLYDSYRSATLNSVQEFSLGNKTIGYIRFWGLTRSTADLFTLELLMREFIDNDGMIVDLRNAYGFLSSKHLDLFVRDGRANFVSSGNTNRQAKITQEFPENSARSFTKPLAVLINSQTRGGAELYAYSLAKLGRVTTLGESSAGRIGLYSLVDNALRYEPADQLLIDGQRIESIGVIPKQKIIFPFSQISPSDPQFEASIDLLLGII